MPSHTVAAVNRVIDHVVTHPEADLRLEALAGVARISPFHFHRVFTSLMGETPRDFVERTRLQRALQRMRHEPGRSLTELALDCGFSSSSSFSRAFKRRYGDAPSALDLDALHALHRAALQDTVSPTLARLPPGENPDGFEAPVRELPPRTLAYLRVHRPYEGTGVVEAADALVAWATARGLQGGAWYGYQWDDPSCVPLELCRYDVAVEVPADTAVDGEVGLLSLPAMRVAEVEVRGTIELEQRALDWIFGTWLPRSAWVPDHQPAFERWDGLPFAHGYEHFELWLQLPVRPAGPAF